MRVSDLLSQKLHLSEIESPNVRGELESMIAGCGPALGIDFLPEQIDAFRRAKMAVPRTGISEVIFLDRPDVNAFVFCINNKATIALSSSLPFVLRALFLAALSEPRIFAGLRDVHYLRESLGADFLTRTRTLLSSLFQRRRTKDINGCDWARLLSLIEHFDFDKFVTWGRTLPPFKLSPDQSGRLDLGIVLSLQAGMFFVFHEFGHFAMKHFEGATTTSSAQAYAEFGSAATTAVSASELGQSDLVRHANEIEADRYAIAKQYSGFYRANKALPSWGPNYIAMTKMGERSRSRLWLVTIGLVFLLFEVIGRELAKTHSDEVLKTHPRPLFRLRQLLEWSRVEASRIMPATDLKDFDLGCAEAIDDLVVLSDKLRLANPFESRADDAEYEQRVKDANAVRARVFEDEP